MKNCGKLMISSIDQRKGYFVTENKKDGLQSLNSVNWPPVLKVKLLTSTAKPPILGRFTDGGYDLIADEKISIRPGETVKVRTGIAIEPPYESLVSLLWDRSSLGSKGIHRLAGMIDNQYRGEILVCLTNLNLYPVISAIYGMEDNFLVDDIMNMRDRVRQEVINNTYHINAGDKICQMVLQSFVKYNVLVVPELNNTDRNEKGFGSSGK